MGRDHYKFRDDAFPHFLTCTVVGWLPVFNRPQAAEFLFESWRFLQENERITLLGYVVLEDHLHFIASAPALSREVSAFKSYTARRIIDWLCDTGEDRMLTELHNRKACHKTDRAFQLWQEGSHPKVLESEWVLRQKLDYIHQNPVKRGYVADPTHWRYSSARNYAGLSALVPVSMDS